MVLTWSIIDWYEDDDGQSDTIKALDNFLAVMSSGESWEQIEELRWFEYTSREEILSTTQAELSELLPNLNLREELLTVGDSGDLVVAISEQLQNLGMEVDNRELYTSKTYEYVISLKSYLKQLDLELYNYLQIGNYCGTP